MKENLVNRFLEYIKVETTSDSKSDTFPSTQSQISFANTLANECRLLGLQDVIVDNYGYVMATLPNNTSLDLPTVGFIAHMDTAPDFCGKNISPQIIENYEGNEIILNDEKDIILSPTQFPILNQLVGETLITTDGTTLLGADDKAGIAEILTAIEHLINHPEIPHGTIRVGFTPDEEVGHGVDHFDVAKFGADFAYTVDGGAVAEIQSSNFNANNVTVKVHGVSVHPGDAKDKMKNSMTIAYKYHSLLPENEVPEQTTGFEGFYHLHDMQCSIEKTVMEYIIRDHDKDSFESRKLYMQQAADKINTLYGANTVEVILNDSYFNMQEIVDQHPEIMELAKQAMINLGISPIVSPIRGGTDGSRLSFMGLPCPNLFTGSYNAHGKFEFAVVSYMELVSKILVEIATLVTTTK
ncbi:MAG: peptidase T [Cellulosilyticaceae bacterium]